MNEKEGQKEKKIMWCPACFCKLIKMQDGIWKKYDSSNDYSSLFDDDKKKNEANRRTITTHWVVGADYIKSDYSYYETVAMTIDGEYEEIALCLTFSYDPDYINRKVKEYEYANNVNVIWEHPDEEWIKQELKALGPWCQWCCCNPCECGENAMRNVWKDESE
jgi:hypothetical protein